MKETIRITASDGYALLVTSFIPRRFNGNIILINSATGVKQSYYSDFAIWLSEQGFKVYTYDYRGIGGSRPSTLKGFDASMHEWGTKDYHSVLRYLFQSFPDSRFIVVGHSVGGQIIGMSALSENVDLVITVGAQTPYWKNFYSTTKLLAFWYFIVPGFTKLFGYFPASMLRLFEDLPAGVALQWARWAKTKNYLFDELPEMKRRFSALQQSGLMISASDDELAPKRAVLQLMKHYTNIRWTHKHLKPDNGSHSHMGHFGFFRKKVASDLWTEIVTWTNQQLLAKKTKAA